MYKYKMINSIWSNDISSGVDAMFNSFQEYMKYDHINLSNKFKDIIKYNELDCKIMFEILEYFKNNH